MSEARLIQHILVQTKAHGSLSQNALVKALEGTVHQALGNEPGAREVVECFEAAEAFHHWIVPAMYVRPLDYTYSYRATGYVVGRQLRKGLEVPPRDRERLLVEATAQLALSVMEEKRFGSVATYLQAISAGIGGKYPDWMRAILAPEEYAEILEARSKAKQAKEAPHRQG